MQINSQTLQALFQEYNFQFDKAFNETPILWGLYADEMPSVTEQSVYAWMAQMTGLREWDGPRQVDNVSARDYTLRNKDFEKTVGLDRNKILDDQFGFFKGTVAQLGVQSALWPEDRVTKALNEGTTTACYDGQPYFDANHPVDLDDATKGVFSNNLVGASYDLAANPVDALANAKMVMYRYQSESTRSLHVIPDTLMVPPELEKAGKIATQATVVAQLATQVGVVVGAAGVTNVWQGTLRLIVNPVLSDTGAWFLMSTQRGLKPLIFQKRQAPVLIARQSPDDPSVFNDKKFLYGVDARGAFGYSYPWLCARCHA